MYPFVQLRYDFMLLLNHDSYFSLMNIINQLQLDLSQTLDYSPSGGRSKMTLSSSHLLCNGLVGDEQDVAEGMLKQ